jgi:hypothetical protein
MKVSKLAVTMALGLSVVVGNPADAKVVIDIFQQGGNVVAAGSGTIDLTDLRGAGEWAAGTFRSGRACPRRGIRHPCWVPWY